MLKVCDKNLVKLLTIIFKNMKLEIKFLNLWTKGNVVPLHKKREKDLMKDFRPVSLLPILETLFGWLIFKSHFKDIDQNELLNPNQSGFCSFDFWVHLLLSINHEIFSNFDSDPLNDTCAKFSDMPKVFAKIWIPVFVFNVKSFGISGDLLELVENFLSNRFLRIVLIGKTSYKGKIML